MKFGKIAPIFIVFILIYDFIKDLLIIMGIIKIENKAFILFSLFFIIFLGFIAKHKYWIIGSVFLGVSEFMKIPGREVFRTFDSVILVGKDYSLTKILISISILFCLIVSSVYFYKFFRLKDFDNYFRKKSK